MTTAGPAQLFEARVRLGCGVCLVGNFFSPQLLFPGLLQRGCVACGVGAESAGLEQGGGSLQMQREALPFEAAPETNIFSELCQKDPALD